MIDQILISGLFLALLAGLIFTDWPATRFVYRRYGRRLFCRSGGYGGGVG